ncbi:MULTISPECIES: DUF4345 family protein [Zhongshania]|jgi:hypothetical protein|uniref:DUF4345 family protein n=1 Tax=Zhongshania aquimaris TaxID=2857107 RepID=A0ABS6VSL2_9GAMM|nr:MULTISPECIES: DUF4345 family protein [Zhongshania]MBQ0795843.1 DUF4345 family protein [Zhongshania sp.]MBW2940750.1 DUF4345 family protein [Zhongshania aquimaris]|tara:strand:- start:2251 stop:2631 length:381 start_codon:yes stop_codon:yes gene_type:complete
MAIFLVYLMLSWFGIGAWLIYDPSALESYAGVAALTPTGEAELRAMYGGMELAIGGAVLLALLRPRWRCHVLFLNGVVAGGIAGGRLVGVALAGTMSVYTASALAFELSTVVICWLLARGLKRSEE